MTHHWKPIAGIAGVALITASEMAAAQFGIASVKPGSKIECSAAELRCLVPAPVFIGPTDSGFRCRVEGATETVVVPKSMLAGGRKIRVVWDGQQDPSNAPGWYKIRFLQTRGVEFVRAVPPDGSVFPPDSDDFADPGWDDDPTVGPDVNRRRFRWTSVNARKVDRLFHYQMNLEWALVGTESWHSCDAKDPKIINKG